MGRYNWNLPLDPPIPTLRAIKGGWAADGNGWAVHGKTKEEAIEHYGFAIIRHKLISAREAHQ